MIDDTARPKDAKMSARAAGRPVFRRRVLLAAMSMVAATPAPVAPTPAAPTENVPTVVVFGDSQAEGLAAALQRLARHGAGFKIQNHTKPGTAISQSQNYDWPAAIKEYEPGADVTTAVVMFGGNDRLPIRLADGTSLPFRTPAWEDVYRDRVNDMLHALIARKLEVIWVGDPICRDPRYSGDMAYLNGIYRDILDGSGAMYLDIWTVVADGDGNYAAYGRALDGTTQRLRLDDGIHFTPSGYDIVAARVAQSIAATRDATR
jgi:uncharacterized protein